MKASELMIGDWVKVADNEFRPGYTSKVAEVYKEAIFTESSENEGECIEEWNITPIQLTPEILKKNGFEYNERPFVQGWEQFGLTLYHGGGGYRVNCGRNVAIQLDSVHQLQHALRLCGIEKEIIL